MSGMAVVIASDVGKDIVGEPLLRGISFKLERRDRMTLSGRNGSGKTTLLRMLAGEATTDFGELVFAKGTKVALHDQRPPRERELTLREYVLSGARELVAIELQLSTLEQAMADGAYDEATLNRYAEAQARLEHAGGYGWRERALSTLHGLGFRDDADLDRSLRTFSGGELTRASLGRALAGDPDLLLLDEPTNHLDIPSLEWLEQHLVALDAAVILVAHDRWFLEAVGTSVLELEAGRGKFFPGPWHAWRKEKAARDLALGRAIERQQAEIARLERFVTRFRAGTRARQAQSRAKQLDRIERLSRDPADGAAPAVRVQAARAQRSRDLRAHRRRRSRSVTSRCSTTPSCGSSAASTCRWSAPTASGKTTLIETLAGMRELDGGKLSTGHNVKIGYLSQHADELSSGTARTVLEAAQHATGLTPGKARALLGRFLFSGDEAEKPLDGLSGGERRRLSLAVLVQSGANVLILDEPTNHLDLESREALEQALGEFPGSLLLVSHDRALLDAVGTRTVAFEDRKLDSYVGGWPEYLRVVEERRARKAAAKPARRKATPAPKPKRKPERERVTSPREQVRLEQRDRGRRGCADGPSKTTLPTRQRGRPRRAPRAPPSATTPPSGRSRTSTAAGRRSRASQGVHSTTNPRRTPGWFPRCSPGASRLTLRWHRQSRRPRSGSRSSTTTAGSSPCSTGAFRHCAGSAKFSDTRATPDQLAAMRLHAVIINPEITGLDYLERLAMALPGPALLVCTGTAPVADRVRGLRGGADDWVTKPCHPEELVARIQAVLRRRRVGEMPVDDTSLTAGELEIRPDMFDAYVGDRPRLAVAQGVRAAAPAGQRRRPRAEREDIYQRVWGYTMVRGDRSVDVFVRKLRQKLEQLSPDWRYVHTHFGVGYRFAAERIGGSPAAPEAAPPQPAPVVEQAPREPVTEQRADPPRTPAGRPGVRLEDHEPGDRPQHRHHPRDRGDRRDRSRGRDRRERRDPGDLAGFPGRPGLGRLDDVPAEPHRAVRAGRRAPGGPVRGVGGGDADADRDLAAVEHQRRLGGVAGAARRRGLRRVRGHLVRAQVLSTNRRAG